MSEFQPPDIPHQEQPMDVEDFVLTLRCAVESAAHDLASLSLHREANEAEALLLAEIGSMETRAYAEGRKDQFADDGILIGNLLAALRMVRMLRQLGGMMPGSREVLQTIIDAAEAAILKATGEQS